MKKLIFLLAIVLATIPSMFAQTQPTDFDRPTFEVSENPVCHDLAGDVHFCTSECPRDVHFIGSDPFTCLPDCLDVTHQISGRDGDYEISYSSSGLWPKHGVLKVGDTNYRARFIHTDYGIAGYDIYSGSLIVLYCDQSLTVFNQGSYYQDVVSRE